MSAALANLSLAVALLLSGISILLFGVAMLAYNRLRHGRMLWVGVAFLILALQGIWHGLEAYANRADPEFPVLSMASLAVVLALYFAVLKR